MLSNHIVFWLGLAEYAGFPAPLADPSTYLASSSTTAIPSLLFVPSPSPAMLCTRRAPELSAHASPRTSRLLSSVLGPMSLPHFS